MKHATVDYSAVALPENLFDRSIGLKFIKDIFEQNFASEAREILPNLALFETIWDYLCNSHLCYSYLYNSLLNWPKVIFVAQVCLKQGCKKIGISKGCNSTRFNAKNIKWGGIDIVKHGLQHCALRFGTDGLGQKIIFFVRETRIPNKGG